ncbi:MAG: universal stress protein [Proteobacteria bacterium]|nr:universal stress protein [Pseudomonadota bacterium]
MSTSPRHPVRSILLHADHAASMKGRIAAARALATRFDASVTAQYCVMSFAQLYPMVEAAAFPPATLADNDEERRKAAFDVFTSAVGSDPRITWSADRVDSVAAFARMTYYNDLTIFGQRDPRDPEAADVWPGLAADVVLRTGQRALILPWIDTPAPIGRRVLIAWNESAQAAHAVHAAMPWLTTAESVMVASAGEDADVMLSGLQRWLAGHGIDSMARNLGPTDEAIGEQILSTAADHGSDLLVMGCYGRSRAREWMMGGASRSVMGSMTVPTLVAH